MNNNIEKIVKLSDHKWIQNKMVKLKNIGTWYYDRNWESIFYAATKREVKTGKNRVVWLPVGFNPETGNWQIDELLMEKLECNSLEFTYWIAEQIKKLKWGSYENHETLFLGMFALKLIWLRELLIKGEKCSQ